MAFSAELFSTTAVRGGLRPDPTTGAVLTPIYQSTTYHQEAVGVHKGFTYSRAANPTVSALESALGALEDTPPAVCFSSGMAAISALFFATLKAGDHVVVSDVVYGGTVRLFQEILTKYPNSDKISDVAFMLGFPEGLSCRCSVLLFLPMALAMTSKPTALVSIRMIERASSA